MLHKHYQKTRARWLIDQERNSVYVLFSPVLENSVTHPNQVVASFMPHVRDNLCTQVPEL